MSEDLGARIDRFDRWPWPWSVMILVGLTYFFGELDVLTIGLAAPAIGAQMHVNPVVVASVGGTIGLIGYLIGALLYSHIADRFGRKIGLAITLISYSVGSLWTAASPDILNVYASRLLTGIGIGADLAVAAAYLSELAPAKARGHYQGFGTFLGFLGAGIIPFLAYVLIPIAAWGWRIIFVIGGLGAVLVIFFRRGLPESPRWLLARGRIEEAERIVNEMEAYYQKRYGALPAVERALKVTTKETRAPIASLLADRRYLPRFLLLFAVFILYYIYAYPVLVMTTSALAAAGYAIMTSLFIVGIGGFGYALGGFLNYLFADVTERKYLISLLLIVQGLTLFGIGIKGPVWEEVLSYFVFAFTNTFLISALYIYAAENFPAWARSTGVALTDGLGHIGPVFMLTLAMIMISTIGFSTTWYVLGIIAIIAGLLVLLGIRSTKRRLEELAE